MTRLINFDGKLYAFDEEGMVYVVNTNGDLVPFPKKTPLQEFTERVWSKEE